MKHAVVAAALVVFAGQTQALSCAIPTLESTFAQVQQKSDDRAIVLGEFRLAAPPGEGDTISDAGVPAVMVTQFSGEGLGPHGFEPVADFTVTINIGKIGPWVGYPPPMGVRAIAFLQPTEAGYVLLSGPCGSDAFSPVTAQDIDLIETLARGEIQ